MGWVGVEGQRWVDVSMCFINKPIEVCGTLVYEEEILVHTIVFTWDLSLLIFKQDIGGLSCFVVRFIS